MEQKKILIADDEQEVLNIISKKLIENNYDVTAVLRGNDVIDICKSNRPDLILLDIVMPDMDGYTVASTLRENKNFKNIPIIFLTGKDLQHSAIEKRVEQLNAYGYLIKPCLFQDILEKVKEVIG